MKCRALVLVGLSAAVLAACGSAGSTAGSAPAVESSTTATTTSLTILTVPELETVTTKLADDYRGTHPDVRVTITTTKRASLQARFVAATSEVAVIPKAWVGDLGAGAVAKPFGRQLAVIAVPTANPHHVTGISDFAASKQLQTAVCGPTTMIGNLAAYILVRANITPNPFTVGSGCEARVLKLVATNKLDAALMFRNELELPAGVKLLDIDPQQNLIADYSFVTLKTTESVSGFVAYLASTPARKILTTDGYLP